ncbi:MAG: chromate transporter [Clostridia bacterium]|nr:chromate transporter [Clostridia bacterium]
MNKLKELFILFLTFFKVGLFTFGGGYAMVAIIEREFVERKKWLSAEEFADVLTIAESTPGPISVNSATYIGYKRRGFFGSVFSTLGLILPSLVIIFCISLFFDEFIELVWVKYAFTGIRAAVVFLILSAGIKLFLKLKKTVYNVAAFIISTLLLVAITLFSWNFPAVFIILIGGAVGIAIWLISTAARKDRNKGGKE